MIPLEIRTELGAQRTTCDCLNCSISCQYVPGFLMPSDLERLSGTHDLLKQIKWAEENLLASPGALVGGRDEQGNLKQWHVHTLVPRRKEQSHACHWLQADGHCAVHQNAPFGCAFFDSHGDPAEQRKLSHAAISQLAALPSGHAYNVIWYHLSGLRKTAPSAQDSRKKMLEAIGDYYPPNTPYPHAKKGKP